MQNENAKYDLLIKNGRFVFPLGQTRPPMDMGIRAGRVAALAEGLREADAAEVLDVAGAVVSPGFVEAHAGLDMAFAAGELCARQTRPAPDALTELARLCTGADDAQAELYARGARALEGYLANGVTTLRAALAPPCALPGLAAFARLRREWAGRIDLLVSLPYEESYGEAWRQAAREGAINAIGCWPDITFAPDGRACFADEAASRAKLDKALALAAEYDLPLDIELCERQGGDIASLAYLCGRLMERKPKPLYGRVACSGATGLGAEGLDTDERVLAVSKCAKLNLRINTCTTDAMAQAADNRRGLPPVRMLLDAGANVAVCCGHMRDTFHPFGRADLLEEALTTAQAHKIGTRAGLRKLFEFITYNPAKTLLLEDYGVLPGCKADLVILDAQSVEDALISRAARRTVLKDGKVVAVYGRPAPQSEGGASHDQI